MARDAEGVCRDLSGSGHFGGEGMSTGELAWAGQEGGPLTLGPKRASSGTSARAHTGAFVPLSLWRCVRSSPCPPAPGGRCCQGTNALYGWAVPEEGSTSVDSHHPPEFRSSPGAFSLLAVASTQGAWSHGAEGRGFTPTGVGGPFMGVNPRRSSQIWKTRVPQVTLPSGACAGGWSPHPDCCLLLGLRWGTFLSLRGSRGRALPW